MKLSQLHEALVNTGTHDGLLIVKINLISTDNLKQSCAVLLQLA